MTDDEVRVYVLEDKWVSVSYQKHVYILRQDTDGLITTKLKGDSGDVALVGITELAESTGCRYGGAAAMCELTFTLGDEKEYSAFFARITEAAYVAGDVFTALIMPLPGSPFFPDE